VVVTVNTTNKALSITAFFAVLVGATHSLVLAIALPIVTWLILLVWETLAVTVVLHRVLTHGSATIIDKRSWNFWLWFARSGGVVYYQWVIIHAWHHANVDTEWDSYTPVCRNTLTGVPPLKAPWPWNFWMNAHSYREMWKYINSHRQLSTDGKPSLAQMAQDNLVVANALARLDSIKWAEEVYTKTGRAQAIDIALLIISTIPSLYSRLL
jgi:fatty-acid desaturase